MEGITEKEYDPKRQVVGWDRRGDNKQETTHERGQIYDILVCNGFIAMQIREKGTTQLPASADIYSFNRTGFMYVRCAQELCRRLWISSKDNRIVMHETLVC